MLNYYEIIELTKLRREEIEKSTKLLEHLFSLKTKSKNK
jgi:hypothetical protein